MVSGGKKRDVMVITIVRTTMWCRGWVGLYTPNNLSSNSLAYLSNRSTRYLSILLWMMAPPVPGQADESISSVLDVALTHPLPTIFINFNFFYPWGNTRPLYLLQNAPPSNSSTGNEPSAAVLLLGSGDFRDILFTLACEDR